MLAQAFATLHTQFKPLGEEVWDRYLKESSARTREEVLADIGLGQRLAVVVAKRLLQLSGQWQDEVPGSGGRKMTSVTIRGTEGMAIQFARCCAPIPGDPIIGLVKKKIRAGHPHA